MENTRAKPDCSTCWKAPECWLAQPGTFCTKYQSKEPERDSAGIISIMDEQTHDTITMEVTRQANGLTGERVW